MIQYSSYIMIVRKYFGLIGNDTCVRYARLTNEQHVCIFALNFNRWRASICQKQSYKVLFLLS